MLSTKNYCFGWSNGDNRLHYALAKKQNVTLPQSWGNQKMAGWWRFLSRWLGDDDTLHVIAQVLKHRDTRKARQKDCKIKVLSN
jgi:hypothetical protein